MHDIAPSVWQLLLTRLRSGYRGPLTENDFRVAQVHAADLLDGGVITRAAAGAWVPPGCEYACLPNFDHESRAHEGLVGVACPYEHPCWRGWKWVRTEMSELFEISNEGIAQLLRELNGLDPLEAKLPANFHALGIARRRGMTVPVVLLTAENTGLESLFLGLREQLGASHLIVVAADRNGPRLASEKVAVLTVVDDRAGDLSLFRAFDLFDPGYRERRGKEASAVFDDIVVEFGEEPGLGHVVRIDGELIPRLAKSDLRFLRLLLLAAKRRASPEEDAGWLPKYELEGDEKDHDLEDVRKALGEWKGIVKGRRDGTVRLAVLPHAIRINSTVSGFRPVAALQAPLRRRRVTTGVAKRLADAKKTLATVRHLQRRIEQLGVAFSESVPRGERLA